MFNSIVLYIPFKSGSQFQWDEYNLLVSAAFRGSDYDFSVIEVLNDQSFGCNKPPNIGPLPEFSAGSL